MNQAEEHAANSAAFAIARHLRYDVVVRGFELKKRYLGVDIEVDLLGLRRDPESVECVEFKLRADIKNQRTNFRKGQLARRVQFGCFRRVYAAWDTERPSASPSAPGTGTLFLRDIDRTSGPTIVELESAPVLPVQYNRRRELFMAKARSFLEPLPIDLSSRAAGGATVFLRCPACGPFVGYYYAVDHHTWVEYPPTNAHPTQHAWFCPQSGVARGTFISACLDFTGFAGDRPVEQAHLSVPIARL